MSDANPLLREFRTLLLDLPCWRSCAMMEQIVAAIVPPKLLTFWEVSHVHG